MEQDLLKLVGRKFKKSRFGQTTQVILHEVRKREVQLGEEGRVDRFNCSIADFKKFYQLLPN